jgi:hypothetical protein
LPPENQQAVEDFVEYLLSKYQVEEPAEGESLAEMRQRDMGRLKGQIWMADDFNKTPEYFKDYI